MINLRNSYLILLAHYAAAKAVHHFFTESWKWQTLVWCFVTTFVACLGVNAGAHRYWSHRAFKATRPLKYLLLFMYTLAAQDSVWFWVANHRIHHKHSDTDKDPHNSTRGFWYSHIGWVLTVDIKKLEEDVAPYDLSDIDNEPVLVFHKKYYNLILPIVIVLLPGLVPYYFWNESLKASFGIGVAWRVVWAHHAAFSINSFAHMWGSKPYDKNLAPSENKWVSIFGGGEGWHNFHHAFPWDYSQNEFGSKNFNPAAKFIELCAWLGLAYDLKTVSPQLVEKRAGRTGDGSYKSKTPLENHHDDGSNVWGWGDPDISLEKLESTEILYPQNRMKNLKS